MTDEGAARHPIRDAANRVPAPLFLIGSGLVQYVGAAIAIGLFALMAPSVVAWWRMLIAGVLLLAWRRPWRHGLTGRDVLVSAVFGVVMGAMNITFYESISRIPLGATVPLEFVGPVVVAVIRGRGWKPRVAAVLALVGVAFIGGLGLDTSEPGVWAGVLLAFAAGAFWAGYIVLGQRIASTRSGLDSLSIGCMAAGIVYAPFFGVEGVTAAATSWHVPLLLVGVAILSTFMPYSLEQIAMGRVSAATFALLTALLPVTSMLVGAVTLKQIPNAWEFGGLVLISLAVWVASHPDDPEAP